MAIYNHEEQLDVFPGRPTNINFTPTSGIGECFNTYLITVTNTFAFNVSGESTDETSIPIRTSLTSGGVTCQSNTVQIGLGTRTTVSFLIDCSEAPIEVTENMTVTLYDDGSVLNWCNGQSTQSLTIQAL